MLKNLDNLLISGIAVKQSSAIQWSDPEIHYNFGEKYKQSDPF